jgi:aminoglycoside 3-N-acetyltransferase|tara:strand:+ start:1762 stop:2520 length:759 start_codon:yes stop_codon:yes gene_type:complete
LSQKNLNKKLDLLFRSLKIKKGDNIIIHSNISGILQFYDKNKEAACELFISYLKKSIGKTGTLIIPAYNYKFTKGESFDVKSSISEVGFFSNYLLKKNWNKRTLDPIFSHLIFGKIDNFSFESINTEAFGKNSLFSNLQKKKIKIFCFCCSPDRITYIHFIEYISKVPYRFVKKFSGNLIHKGLKKKIIYEYNVGKKSIDYSIKEKKITKLLNNKEFKREIFGKFECYLFKGDALITKFKKILKKNKYYLVQ